MSATITLRPYQEDALSALFDWFSTKDGDALCVLPTGAGKSLVMGTLIARARENYPPLRAVVLAMRAELVKQNAKAAGMVLPARDIGIYSASVGIKDHTKPITVANIQSLAKNVYAMDPPDLICLDEAQNLADSDTGLLRQYFASVRKQNPNVKIVGFTATPYKLSSGRLDEGPGALFAGVAYEANVLELIQAGYLARPTTPRSSVQLDTTNVATRGGEFIQKELAAAVDVDAITEAAVAEDVRLFGDRSHWVVFAVNVEHAHHLAEAYTRHGVPTAVVYGELSRDERAYRLHAFHMGEVRCLVSVALLTEGWDEPKVSAISLMRPTASVGLYVQMVGRGLRLHPSKTDCLVADHSGLINRFGPIDALRLPDRKKGTKKDQAPPAKLCPVCETFQATGVRECVGCGYAFPPPAIELSSTASSAPITSLDAQPVELVEITNVQYQRHEPKPPKTTPTLRVDYYRGYRRVASEWVCIEHDGFARQKAERWWLDRSPDTRPPATVDDALLVADDLLKPEAIQLQPDPKNPQYTRIVGYRFPALAPTDSGLPKACWTCAHWVDTCTKWHAAPPAEIQQAGCDDWTDLEPLPF